MKPIFFLEAIVLIVLLPAAVFAQELRISPDVTVSLSGTVLQDENVGQDDLSGSVDLIDTGSFPENTDITAYHRLENGAQLLALDTTVVLGSLTVERGDVVGFYKSVFAMELDASALGVPNGVMVDALSVAGSDLVLSFDTTVSLGKITVEDQDLVRYDDGFSLFFDGSDAGVPAALDLDAAHVFGAGRLRLSFDTSGKVDGIAFDDEDVLVFDLADKKSWSLAYDGSARHSGWTSASLDALWAKDAGIIDTDNDGIPDDVEDTDQDGEMDFGETDPYYHDSDFDGIQDGTEIGLTADDVGPGTNLGFFQEDLDPSTTTDPLNTDTDNDGLLDGEEDANHNGRVDPGETDPNKYTNKAMPWLMLLLDD